MVMTVLEAHVAPENVETLQSAYAEAIKDREPGLVQTFVLHSTADETLWRIATLWESREALMKMRELGTPRGVLMFRAAGAEPALNIFEVAASATK